MITRPKEDEEKNPEEVEENNKHIANYFFSFLEQETLNVTLVGYFTRFLNHLILKRGIEASY